MNNTAWVFPGQGSQFVGMGRELSEQYPEARAVFDSADSALGFSLSRLCFDGPEAELTDTVNAQPALLTHSIAALAAWRAALGGALSLPIVMAGHSLGEYSALVAAGALELVDAVQLVRARGEAMKHAGEQRPGAMAAILGLDDEKVREICAQAGAVQVANFNAPGQIVISGEKQALNNAATLAKQAGAKRVMPLAVSIAAHSALMQTAADEFRPSVVSVKIRPPAVPVISNVTVQPLDTEEAIRVEMLAQLTSPVQWVKSVETMAERGVQEFIELGPKDVLAGLVRRCKPGIAAVSIGNPGNIQAHKPQSAGE